MDVSFSVTGPVNPPTGVTVMVVVAEAVSGTPLGVVAEIVKSAAACTIPGVRAARKTREIIRVRIGVFLFNNFVSLKDDC